MTRLEAEEKILKNLEEIRETYLAYNPDGDFLNICISKRLLLAENYFSLGGEDYDHPLSVKKLTEKKEEKK